MISISARRSLKNPVLCSFINVRKCHELQGFQSYWNRLDTNEKNNLIKEEIDIQNHYFEDIDIDIETKVKTGFYIRVF